MRANSPLRVGPQWAALEEPGGLGDLVGGLPDPDRGAQKRSQPGGGDPGQGVTGAGRGEVAVDGRRAHRQQLGSHRRRVSVGAEDELAMGFQAGQLQAHRGGQVLPALTPGERPHSLQHFERVIRVPAWPVAGDHGCPMRAGRRRQPATGVVTRPARDRDHLVEQTPLHLLRRPPIRPRIPGRYLHSRAHRQTRSHAGSVPPVSRASLYEAPRAARGHNR